ncbi:dynein regulatory complex subunit 2 [Andrena cerasifolii]|uniref:dynein regulatory complex subunit 2 n=1 Tax=Andrena cerasifolii TaxID=2819439 RepID=UPI0040379AD1
MLRKPKRRVRSKMRDNVQDTKKNALIREIELSALNTLRYRRLWREILMRMKMPDTHRKIELAWQTLERALDLKDYSISLLMDSLQEAEDQRRTAYGAHAEVIDRSLKTHEARLEVIDTLFYRNIETALVDKVHESEDINCHRNTREIDLRKINLLVNHRSENAAYVARSIAISKIKKRKFQGTVNAFVEDGENERRLIATQLQKQLEDGWDNLRNIFSNYRKSTEDRRKVYAMIQRKDQSDRESILRQGLHIANLLEDVAKFREKINSCKIDAENELQDMTQQSNFIHDAYREANGCFTFANNSPGRKTDKNRKMIMSREYANSVKRLKGLKIKAERMLLYMEMCRKYETQDEKILPPVIDHATLDTRQAATHNTTESSSFDLVAEDSKNLISFWHRLGFVQLIAAELRMERDRLLMRATDLQKSVQRCFTNETT